MRLPYMRTHQALLGLATFAVIGCGADAGTVSPDSDESTQGLRVGAASGTLYFAGCTPTPRDLVVQASPLAATVVGGREVIVQPGDSVGRVTPAGGLLAAPGLALPTRDPHTFRFTFPTLNPGAYQLSVQVNAAACAGARWRGPTGGVIFAGQHDRRFEAIVPRTRLGVVRPRGRVAFGADMVPLDAERGPTARSLSVQTTLDDQTEYELQLSTGRPTNTLPRLRGRCVETSGILYRQPLSLRPRTTTLVAFDLSQILARLDGLTIGDTVARARMIPSVEYRRGRPLYVRVVPVRAQCNPEEEGTSASVTLHAPPLATASAIYAPRLPIAFEGHFEPGSQSALYNPQPTSQCFQALSNHVLPHAFSLAWINDYNNDPFGGILVMQGVFAPLTTLPEGTIFCVTPSSGSGGNGFLGGITGTFGEVVTGAIDATAWTVNEASAAYEEIQQAVVNAVAAALDAIPGVDCDATCRAGLQLALKTGMAAMGVPPSIPNFDQLMDEGIDYLAASAAEQAGIPPEVASVAVRAAVDQLKAQRGVATAATPNAWYAPAEPGVNETTRLRISVPPGWLDQPGSLDVYSTPFTDATFSIPRTPGVWTIPIVHRRNYEGMASPPPTVVSTLLGPLAIAQSESYVQHWYFTQWRAQRMPASCLMQQFKLRSANGNLLTGAVPFVRPFTANDWSTPSNTNRCQ